MCIDYSEHNYLCPLMAFTGFYKSSSLSDMNDSFYTLDISSSDPDVPFKLIWCHTHNNHGIFLNLFCYIFSSSDGKAYAVGASC